MLAVVSFKQYDFVSDVLCISILTLRKECVGNLKLDLQVAEATLLKIILSTLDNILRDAMF